MVVLASAASLLTLIAGSILGTFASRYVFGKPTSAALSSLEIASFTALLALGYFSSSLLPLPKDALYQLGVFLAAGLFSAFLAGAIATLAGKHGDKHEAKSLEELRNKQRAADELFKNLLQNGFPKTSARQCLLNCGFSEPVVENALKKSGAPAPHPLVRRIAALEEKLRRKKK